MPATKTPAAPKTVVHAKARAIMAKLNKELGEGTAVLGSEMPRITRCPTGSLGLDLALGGGWPLNQWNEIVGLESHGKTAVCLKTIAANQARDPEWTAVWIAAERWVQEWAETCGVDTDRVLVVNTNSMEDAYEAVIRFAESRVIDCVVIDSLPALVPTREYDNEMGQMAPGLHALLTGQFFRKVGPATKRALDDSERPFLGLVINQWRLKIGVMHGDPRTTPGGVGKNYHFFTRVEVSRTEKLYVGKGDNKRRVGQEIKFRVFKNKTAGADMTAAVDFYNKPGAAIPPGEYDFAKECMVEGILRGVITKGGGGMYGYEDRKWKGAPALLASIREEPDLKDRMIEEVMDAIGAIIVDDEDGDDA